MEVVGYALIKGDAKSGMSPIAISNFLNKPVRVLEFTRNGDVLVVDTQSTGLATFDACDIRSKFECSVMGEYIMPPGLNEIEKMIYVGKLQSRKGGWAPILKHMVIMASLHKQQYNDAFLWQKQDGDKEEFLRHRSSIPELSKLPRKLKKAIKTSILKRIDAGWRSKKLKIKTVKKFSSFLQSTPARIAYKNFLITSYELN